MEYTNRAENKLLSDGTVMRIVFLLLFSLNLQAQQGTDHSWMNAPPGETNIIAVDTVNKEIWGPDAIRVYEPRIYIMDDESTSLTADDLSDQGQITMSAFDIDRGIIFDRTKGGLGTRHPLLFRSGINFTTVMRSTPVGISFVHGGSSDPALLSDESISFVNGVVTIADAYTLPTADGTARQVLTTDGLGVATFAPAMVMASYNCNNDTQVNIGAGSNSYFNWTTCGAAGFTSDSTVLVLSTSDITAIVTGTVRITACLRNTGDGRRVGIRIGTTNIQETGGTLANSWPCLTVTRNINAGQQIRLNNPGTGSSNWRRATLSVIWMSR